MDVCVQGICILSCKEVVNCLRMVGVFLSSTAVYRDVWSPTSAQLWGLLSPKFCLSKSCLNQAPPLPMRALLIPNPQVSRWPLPCVPPTRIPDVCGLPLLMSWAALLFSWIVYLFTACKRSLCINDIINLFCDTCDSVFPFCTFAFKSLWYF